MQPLPYFIPGKPRLPADFQLWPDGVVPTLLPAKLRPATVEAPPLAEALAVTPPLTPPIPPTVAAGDVITAAHENTVTTALGDLWTDAQWMAANFMINPTTSKGDIIVNDGTGPNRLTIGAASQVLTVDTAAPFSIKWAAPAVGGVSSVYGRVGAVVAQAGDYTAALVTNAVDATGAYANPAWITSLAWSKITGAPAGGSQTPWTSDIDGASHKLNNVAGIGIGGAAGSSQGIYIGGSGIFDGLSQINGGANGWAGFNLQNDAGHTLALRLYGSARANPDIARFESSGAPFAIVMSNAEAVRVTTSGNMGVGNAAPAYKLDVSGDVNCTGVFRVNGVPLATGGGAQTPWTSDIDAASYKLSNVSYMGIGTAAGSPGTNGIITIRNSNGNYNQAAISILGFSSLYQPTVTLMNDAAKFLSVGVVGSGSSFSPNTAFINAAAPLTIQANGTEIARFLMNGNFGIGTVTPTRLLEVFGPVTGVPVARFGNANQSVDVGGYDSVSNSVILNCSGGGIALQTQGANRLVIAYAGNVGIGVSVAAYKVDVAGDCNITGAYRVNGAPLALGQPQTPWAQNINGGGFALSNVISVSANSVNANAVTISNGLKTAATVASLALTSSDATNPLQAFVALYGSGLAPSRLAIGCIEQNIAWKNITLCESAGSVAVGLTSPGATLHVAGASGIGLSSSAANGTNGYFYLLQSSADQTSLRLGYWSLNAWAGNGGLQLTYNGQVGVGMAPTICTLQANGSIGAMQATNVHATLGFDPGSAAANVNIVGMFYDATNNVGRIDAITGGVLWRSICLCARPNTGNVGIGNVAPANQLTIIPAANPATADGVNALGIGEASNNAAYRLVLGYYLDSAAGVYRGVIRSMAANSEAASSLCLNPLGGFVGVGVPNPSTSLHVSAPSGPTYLTIGPAAGMAIEIQGNNGNYANIAHNAYQSSGAWALRDTSREGWANGFTSTTNSAGAFSVAHFAAGTGAATTVFYLTSAGNLALGPNFYSPAYRLDVVGDVNCTGSFRVNGAPHLAATIDALTQRIAALEARLAS